MPYLALYLLGPPRVERDGLPLNFGRRRALALLAYLAVTGHSHRRDTLATLFWPEHDQSRARAGLRRALTSLKSVVGEGWLAINRESAGLDPAAEVRLDVEDFRRLLADCEAHGHGPDEGCASCLAPLGEAVALYRDDFLAGFTVRGSPGFDEWQFFEGEGLRRELAGALERLAGCHSARGELEPAIEYARRRAALDPLHEPAHRCLMRLYARSGERAAALRQYGECRRLLGEELGVPPEEETTQLYEAIRADRELVGRGVESGLQARYRLQPELGRGGAGVVYRAYDTVLERNVAVKVLSDTGLGAEGRARLLGEARAAAALNHANIVSVYDAGETDGTAFIVMELVDGRPLPVVRPRTAADWTRAIALTRQVCAALEHAHEHGIVHRDLKPENVLLAQDPVTGAAAVKLVDFGLARSMASRLTATGSISGTVFYLAPELALGRPYDGRADLYSLGAMLYELATGRLPFVGDDPVAVISQHLHAQPVPPRARNDAIPPVLDDLILRLLSKDPDDRPASAREVMRLLDEPHAARAEAGPVLERIERGRMVGREGAMRRARELWQMAMGGQGATLVIAGEPGIGKTRLVRELVTQATVSGGRALQGGCYVEGSVPYAAFVHILEQAVAGEGGEGSEPPEPLVAGGLSALAPALDERVDRPAPAAGGDPQAEQHRLLERVALAVAALAASSPLLLVLEDVQWADSGTLQLWRHLARRTRHSGTLIVATCRETGVEEAWPLHQVLTDLRREGLATEIKLERLDREQTGELLAVLFEDEITPAFLDGIYGETEGNPFFVEEICKALVESGKLRFEEGRWRRPSMKELGVPQTVRAAIQSRLNALPAAAQQALRLAAVLGRRFELEILAAASGQDKEALLEVVEDARRAQLVEKVSPQAGGTYALAHALIATTLLESVRPADRRRLHRRVAVAIEARHPGDGSRLEALAYHYCEAGEAGRAARYLLQAGDRARGLYAHQEAIAHYRQAVGYIKAQAAPPDAPERTLRRAARALIKLGLAHHNALQFEASRRAYDEAFDLWRRAGRARVDTSSLPPPQVLRIRWPAPATLDPSRATQRPEYVAASQLFQGLVELSQDLDVVPGVAYRWEVSDGGRRYVFHLRHDARWSDGTPVSAADFRYAWMLKLDPAAKRSNWSLLYDIKGARAFYEGRAADGAALGVRAPDEATLVVELEQPAGYFLEVLASESSYPVPRHLAEAHGDGWAAPDNLASNGPFRLESWQPGGLLVLARNPAYHGPFGGNVGRVEWSPPAGQGSASDDLAAYETGAVDVCRLVAPQAIDRARQRHADDYVSVPAANVGYLAFDLSRPPFDDRRVRHALAMAVDKEGLADVVTLGYDAPAHGGFVPPQLPGHSAGIGLPYDPDRARRLLAEAGYPGGAGFPRLRGATPLGATAHGDFLAEQWRGVLGIEVGWQDMEAPTMVDGMLTRPFPLFLYGWAADYPDPSSFLKLCPISRLTGWRDEAYDRLLASAGAAADEKERIALYRQAEEILVEAAPIVPMLYGHLHLLVKPWVSRYPLSPLTTWLWRDVIVEPH